MKFMRAFLDEPGRILICVKKDFFAGKVDWFYLSNSEGLMSEMTIITVEELDSEIRYTCSCPGTLSMHEGYFVRQSHGYACPLRKRLIVKTDAFNDKYDYDGDDLGAVYHRYHTDFAVWAPTSESVTLKVTNNGRRKAYAMERTESGVWRMSVMGDLKHATYTYLIKRNGIVVETLDPYALSSTGNGRESAVIDTDEITRIYNAQPEGHIDAVDAVIYEASVRDMTSNSHTGSHTHGTFTALSETETSFRGAPTGLDYIASLGVTHVQLQPVMDFATVDEFQPTKSYNWGYDPAQFLSPEGSYSSDPDDPYARVKELRSMVAAFHDKGLRVNLDVVFNHLYMIVGSPFDNLVPFYFFRYNANAYPSNGSFCGNDFASEMPMARRYIIHCITTLMKLYGIDGFRFDLMGILDVDTMNEVLKAARKINPDVMIYGEGWDLPTLLDKDLKANILNQAKMPGIGHFNDFYRDILKGRTGDNDKYDQGYVTGDLSKAFAAQSAFVANVLKEPYLYRFDEPGQSINGAETHDNGTVWDKMHYSNNNEDRATRQKRQKMMLCCQLVAQGVPFLHAGMEFCGTKNDNFNSYNAGDAINGVDWVRASINASIIEYTRRCTALRRRYSAFRLKTAAEIERYVRVSLSEGNILFYDITHQDPYTHSKMVRVIVNPTYDTKYYTFPEAWRCVLDENGEEAKESSRDVCVPGLSVIVFAQEEEQHEDA
ncbi:MAG: type I pullulanase [Solobacterium sp.]|nr:type I pullulanase [Solobacterium sp.]